MCGSMVDIQSATLKLGEEEKKRKKKLQDENIMSASATQGGHKEITGQEYNGLPYRAAITSRRHRIIGNDALGVSTLKTNDQQQCLDHRRTASLISSWLIMYQQLFRTCFRWSVPVIF